MEFLHLRDVFVRWRNRQRDYAYVPPKGLTDILDTDPSPDSVLESAANGTNVGITAYAFDPGYTVTYTLSNDAVGRFAIDAQTGVVTKISDLDYAVATQHTIVVRATTSRDNGYKERAFVVSVTADLPDTLMFPLGFFRQGLFPPGFFPGNL